MAADAGLSARYSQARGRELKPLTSVPLHLLQHLDEAEANDLPVVTDDHDDVVLGLNWVGNLRWLVCHLLETLTASAPSPNRCRASSGAVRRSVRRRADDPPEVGEGPRLARALSPCFRRPELGSHKVLLVLTPCVR